MPFADLLAALEVIEQRARNTPPGPYLVSGPDGRGYYDLTSPAGNHLGGIHHLHPRLADGLAAFFATANMDVLVLVDECRRLYAQLDAAMGELDRACRELEGAQADVTLANDAVNVAAATIREQRDRITALEDALAALLD